MLVLLVTGQHLQFMDSRGSPSDCLRPSGVWWRRRRPRRAARMDGYLLSELMRAVRCGAAPHWVRAVATFLRHRLFGADPVSPLQILPAMPPRFVLDIGGYSLVSGALHQRLAVDCALCWLSTLGGAFSNLGEQFEDAALLAGLISRRQMRLALRLADVVVQAKCQLWLATSLMQRAQLRPAARLLRRAFHQARHGALRNCLEGDKVAVMTRGLWSKLRYLWQQRRAARSGSGCSEPRTARIKHYTLNEDVQHIIMGR